MTAKELKTDFSFCRDVEVSNQNDDTINAMYRESKEQLEKAKQLILSNMTKRKALIVHDYIFTDKKLEAIASERDYSITSVKNFIKEANNILKAL